MKAVVDVKSKLYRGGARHVAVCFTAGCTWSHAESFDHPKGRETWDDVASSPFVLARRRLLVAVADHKLEHETKGLAS